MIVAETTAEQLQQATAAGRRRLRHHAADAWRPDQIPLPSTWAVDHVQLSADIEASGGPYQLATRPWAREILDAIADPEVREITLAAGTQVGKTLGLIAGVLWCAVNAPGPGMVVVPDRDAAIEFRDRLYATAEASGIWIPPEHLWNTRHADVGRMRVYLAWSGSRQRLRGRPCRYVWLSEVDVYQGGDKKAGDPLRAAGERVKAFYRSLVFRESSPSADPSAIDQLERQATDRRRWHGQCPKCGRWQEVRFFTDKSGSGGLAGYRDSAGELLPAEDARRSAYYCCTAGCKIEQDQRRAFMLGGRWVPVGQRLTKRGQLRGPAPSARRSLGFRQWAAMNLSLSWGDIAAAYIDQAESGQLAEFYGNWLGLSYQSKRRLPSWKAAGHRLAADYPRGQIPAAAWFLTAGADVQDDRVYAIVRAWGPDRQSWLVDWAELMREETDSGELVKTDLAKLGRWALSKTWPVIGGSSPTGQSELRVRLLNCDSNHRTIDVHEWIRSLPAKWRREPSERVRAVRGDHQVEPGQRFRVRTVERSSRDGTVYRGGLRQWGIYVRYYYAEQQAHLVGLEGTGNWRLPRKIAETADGKKYLQQLTNFHETILTRSGRAVRTWQPRNDRVGVDYWDCEIYARCAADMVLGGLGWRSRDWERHWLPDDRPKRPHHERPSLGDR